LKYLLDTQAWIWAVLNDSRLGTHARRVLNSLSEETIGLAAISLKEASWLLARGRIVVDTPSLSWADWLRLASSIPQLDILPLTVEVAIESEQFSNRFPSDPADRLIGATARVHGLILLTSDRSIRRTREVATVW
jgi:PIN domain nuclease of toxin-antitoxin system